jgi:hypothetical protein
MFTHTSILALSPLSGLIRSKYDLVQAGQHLIRKPQRLSLLFLRTLIRHELLSKPIIEEHSVPLEVGIKRKITPWIAEERLESL